MKVSYVYKSSKDEFSIHTDREVLETIMSVFTERAAQEMAAGNADSALGLLKCWRELKDAAAEEEE